jgi:hypothetical protein
MRPDPVTISPARRWLLFACCLFLLAACTGGDPPLTSSGRAEGQGIPVAAEFEPVYQAFGGRRVFGGPITEAFTAEPDGPLIQYFQTMRLEYDAAQPQPVRIYPLGEWALEGLVRPEPAPVKASRQARYFAETGETVQDEFLAFYQAYDGEQLLGLPISPQLDEGGVRVQYFQNGRLEWHPELTVEQRIQLGLLGKAHFDAEMVFRYRQLYLARPVSSAGITEVNITAVVRAPVLYQGEEQVLFVTVLAPDGRPVAGIAADVTLTYDDAEMVIELGRTDEAGRLQAALDLTAVPPGQPVELLVSVYGSDGRVIGSTTLGFRTWW